MPAVMAYDFSLCWLGSTFDWHKSRHVTKCSLGLLALITSVIAVYEIAKQHLNPGHSCLWLCIIHRLHWDYYLELRLRENNGVCIRATRPHQSK